jgi:hypothetical protein
MRRSIKLDGLAAGVACLALCLATATAAPAPSDPDLGSHWPFEHTFASQPPRGQVTPGSACEVGDAFMRGNGASLADLFAEDAVFMGPYDIIYRGREEIRLWFGRPGAHDPGKPEQGPPKIVPVSFVDRGDECFVEVSQLRPNTEPGQPDRYRLVAIDHFTIGPDRKIERLVIYGRPDPMEDLVRRGLAHGRSDWPIPPSGGR